MHTFKKGDRILVTYIGWSDIKNGEILVLHSSKVLGRTKKWTAQIFSKENQLRNYDENKWWSEGTLSRHIDNGYIELLCEPDTDTFEPGDYYDKDNIILD